MTYICNVMPHICSKVCRPLRDTAHIPAEIGVACAYLATNPARLHLGEVTLEKANLVLSVDTGEVCASRHHT